VTGFRAWALGVPIALECEAEGRLFGLVGTETSPPRAVRACAREPGRASPGRQAGGAQAHPPSLASHAQTARARAARRTRARRGQLTRPQDVACGRPAWRPVRELPTAPRRSAYGLTRFACQTAV